MENADPVVSTITVLLVNLAMQLVTNSRDKGISKKCASQEKGARNLSPPGNLTKLLTGPVQLRVVLSFHV